MTSPGSQHDVPQEALERDNSGEDDPWCLICGVNLALDSRTYTTVSRHNSSDLCGIFSRVLGAEFSEDYASVNLCNSCERQLRRLGRYNSIVLARHEGAKLREQLEKNLAKHDQQVVESGQDEEVQLPASGTEDTTRSETTASFEKGYEGHSSIRRSGKYTSRSVSSVHFEDKEETGRRQAVVRKYSAPEGFRKRDSRSPFNETLRRREARRRKWSSASSTSEESTGLSSNRKLSLESRTIAISHNQHRYATMSDQNTLSSDPQQEISDQATVTNSSTQEVPNDRPLEVSISEINSEQEKKTSCENQDSQVQKSFSHEEGLIRMDTLQADDELFKTLDDEPIREDQGENEFWNDSEVDPNDFNADNRSILSEVEDRITTKTKFKGAYYNIGSTEDLLQEFANENDRERAMWSKLTYTESIDMGDGGGNPVRPPRRKSLKSSLKKRDGQSQDTQKGSDGNDDKPEQIMEECESPDGIEADHHEVRANGIMPDKEVAEDEDGKTIARFDMETPEGTDSQIPQDTTAPKTKTEKSPLIGKDDGSSNLQMRNGSRLKKQMGGFLCCRVL